MYYTGHNKQSGYLGFARSAMGSAVPIGLVPSSAYTRLVQYMSTDTVPMAVLVDKPGQPVNCKFLKHQFGM